MIMPMGKKVLSKVENIIREEMDAKDAQELLMPALIPEDVYVHRVVVKPLVQICFH